MGLNWDLSNYNKPDTSLQKFLAPWDDSPGKGSRDILMQDAMGWGRENLGKYLVDSGGDPYGIFDAGKVTSFLDAYNAPDTSGYNWNEGSSQPPEFYATPKPQFTDFTLPELQTYLTKASSRPDTVPGGDWANIGQGFWDKANSQNDIQWMPKFYEQDGKQYVTWGQKNSKGGFLDKISPMVENALALSGFAAPALGASIAGAGALEGAGAFGGEALGAAANAAGAYGGSVAPWITSGAGGLTASWGVNPQTGGTMDLGDWLNLDDIGSFGEGLRDVSIPGNGLTGIPNLQDIMVNLDKLPPGTGSAAKSLLSKFMGGNASGSDLASLIGILGSTGLGMLGSNKQAESLTEIANQSRADRQPFLNKSLEWLINPAAYYSSEPAQAAMKGVLHGLSVNGNPANNPTAMATATEAGLRNWQNAVTGFGNIGLAGQDSRNSLLTNAAQSQSGVYDALGYGLSQLTQPKQSLSDLARAFGITGLA